MKKALTLTIALMGTSAFAAPFVLPAAWMAQNPAEAKTCLLYTSDAAESDLV